MSAIANDNASKAAPAESVIKNGPPTPPETQASSDAKAPDLPPITKEPAKTAAAPMVPVPTGEPNKQTAPASAEKTDPALPSGGDPQQEEPETKEPSANSLANGETKKSPKPVSIEEVPDRELPKAHPPSPPAEAQLEEAKPDNADEKVDDASSGDVVMTSALPPRPEAESAKDSEKAEGPVADAPEASKAEPQAGDKRKADDAAVPNGDASAEMAPEKQAVTAEKKLKTDDAPAATNGSPKKPGRPKKSDKPAAPVAPVGRTARKTRSQGAAE